LLFQRFPMPRPSTVAAHADLLRTGQASVRALVDAALAAIASADPVRPQPEHTPGPAHLNALTQVFEDDARQRAAALDAQLAAWRSAGRSMDELPALFGVPVAIKENICTTLGRTTCASRMLAGYRSPFDATAITGLLNAGAVIVGKTNMDEFGMGSSGEHSCFGVTRNPWDHSRVCGGSSSGSAACVAAGLTPIALGSDTGGSVRQPAALTGCVGLKPTYGRVSRSGLVAYASSLEQIGPMGRCVADVAAVLDAIAGPDPLDSTAAPQPPPDAGRAVASVRDDDDTPLKGLTIGVLAVADDACGSAPLDAVARSARAAADAGARLVELTVPELSHAIATYYIIATAEASSNLARYDGVRYGARVPLEPGQALTDLYELTRSRFLGAEVQRRILLGTFVLSAGYAEAYYARALRARRLIHRAFQRAFERVDALLMPATPEPAFRIGQRTSDPMALYLADVYTVPANLAGVPAVSLPIMRCDAGGASLPVGVQVVGRWFEEASMLRVARAIERAVGFAPLVLPG
jgi:aspartyl-tRNA(Asn)/glutamyl-tRNA(Gln) amidotransferase subunit A